jgi:hypothetical protein
MDRVQAEVEQSQGQTVYVPVYSQIQTGDNERVFFFTVTQGQTVYVPVYSHIYTGDKEQPFDLTVTLSIRNTDARRPMEVPRIRYHDSKGELVREYLAEPIRLGPLETTRFVVKESDRLGGSGASFVVIWRATSQIAVPVMETIMIGTRGGQGLSFSSRGKAISEPQLSQSTGSHR